MKSYVIWVPAKIELMTGKSCETLEELMALELEENYGFSSVVYTDDIDSVVEAFLNEAGVAIHFAEYEV